MGFKSLNDLKRDWLSFKGYSSAAVQDSEFKYFENLSGSTKTSSDNIYNLLGTYGRTGALPDRLYSYLRDCTGKENLNDQLHAYYSCSAAIDFQITGTAGGDRLANVAGTNTRGSAGTYVSNSVPNIVEVTGGNARKQYVPALGRTGTLFERASTNRMAYSEDFSQSGYWVKTNITLGTNVSASPISGGGNIADSVINSGTALGNIKQTYAYGTTIASINWMGSIWIYGSSVSSNIELQLYGDTSGSVTANKTITPGAWTRIDILGTALTGTSVTFVLHLGQGSTITSDKFFIWGAQLERQAESARWPTAYMRNSGSTTAGRNQDYLLIGTSATSRMLNTSAGSLMFEYTPQYAGTSLMGITYGLLLFAYANAAGNQQIVLSVPTAAAGFRLRVRGSATDNYASSGSPIVPGTAYRVIAIWDKSGTVISSGGSDYRLAIYYASNSGSGWSTYTAGASWSAANANFAISAADSFCEIGYDNVFLGSGADGVISKALIATRAIPIAEASHILAGDF